jgi:hypothetical protein
VIPTSVESYSASTSCRASWYVRLVISRRCVSLVRVGVLLRRVEKVRVLPGPLPSSFVLSREARYSKASQPFPPTRRAALYRTVVTVLVAIGL